SFLRDVEGPLSLGKSDLGAKDFFALDDPPLAELPGHIEIVLAAADRLACDSVQRPSTEQLIICDRHVVSPRLIGAFDLKLGDVRGDAGLVITSQPPPEIADQPLEFQFS